MNDLIKRFIAEEDASLDMWITVIIFMLITIGAYLIVWKNWGRQATKDAVEQVGMNMENILTDDENWSSGAGLGAGGGAGGGN